MLENQFSTPVLFLLFNRPLHTQCVFQKIRELKPKELYVAADGPRPNRQEDVENCKQARQVVLDNIDWDCHIHTLLRDHNLGCGLSVSSSITWFFENVEEGIILEDDCVPELSFFFYCSDLLMRFRNEERMMHIGGSNFLNRTVSRNSYYFSKYPHIWGWATWKRAWNTYKFRIDDEVEGALPMIFQTYEWSRAEKKYWTRCLLEAEKVDTWDCQWAFAVWRKGGLSILPSSNLILNIGFDGHATHTKHIHPEYQLINLGNSVKMIHPSSVEIETQADNAYFDRFLREKHTFMSKTKKLAINIIPGSIYDFLKKLYYKFQFKEK
jgi:hypothetical protein